MTRFYGLTAALIWLALPAAAAEPGWPCIQRRQPALSVAQIWPGPPIPDAAAAAAEDPAIRALAQQLAQRSTALEDAGRLITTFAAAHPPAAREALFLATFAQIQQSRSRVLDGIARYARKQAELDTRINTERRVFEALLAAEPKDFDAIDKAEAAVDWSTRIFLDRQQSLTYVCESPVILEQRIFALARLIAASLKAP